MSITGASITLPHGTEVSTGPDIYHRDVASIIRAVSKVEENLRWARRWSYHQTGGWFHADTIRHLEEARAALADAIDEMKKEMPE